MPLQSPEDVPEQPVKSCAGSPETFFSRDSTAFDAVYEELRRAAHRLMTRTAWDERSLDPTGLVHEAVLRLIRSPNLRDHADPNYVFAAALTAMRRILVDRDRERKRLKRGGNWHRVAIDPLLEYFAVQHVDVAAMREAIDRLAEWDPRQAEVVTMRYYLGMKIAEIARHKGLSEFTVESDLRLARAWLRRELGDDMPEP